MSQTAAGSAPARGGFGSLVRNWTTVINTSNLPRGASMDPVSKWLIITRASVFSMTITSGLIGGLLAAQTDDVSISWWFFALAMAGLVLAHAANNMINDYFDTTGGVDDPLYPRAQYMPHPLLSNLISKRGLITAILAVNVVDAAIMLYLTSERGPLVLLFALLGLFISVFYVAPPIVLKRRGLGEIGVLIVWGPLMIGGTYFIAAGEIAPWVWAACAPYSLVVMCVLIGKHLDKFDVDSAKGIRTLPVLLGYSLSRRLNQVLMAAFYVVVAALILTGTLGVWVALVLLALPRFAQVMGIYNRERPEEPPPNYPIWPLWYVAWAMSVNRVAGGLLVLGLLLDAIYPVHLG